jgi:hypothetical protein
MTYQSPNLLRQVVLEGLDRVHGGLDVTVGVHLTGRLLDRLVDDVGLVIRVLRLVGVATEGSVGVGLGAGVQVTRRGDLALDDRAAVGVDDDLVDDQRLVGLVSGPLVGHG